MKAMILAAGLGTRLGEITESTPKVLVEINGKSVLQIAVEKCAGEGFNDLIINVHHFADRVEDEIKRLRQMGYRITISDERNSLLETGGGLYNAKDFFDNSAFLLYNADIVTDMPLATLYGFHLQNNALVTLGVRNALCERCFLINTDGIIKGWQNKRSGEMTLLTEKKENLREVSFSGVHIIDPEIFRYMYAGAYSITGFYLDLARTVRINTFMHNEGYWFDIGTPQELSQAIRHLSLIS
jgi:NDP-sugar pyrophosphorylase family protein